LSAVSGAGGTIELRCVRCGTLSVETTGEQTPDSTPAEPEGCVSCNSPDVRYVLITDVPGSFTRMGFCSVDCLGKKLGLVRPPTAVDPDHAR